MGRAVGRGCRVLGMVGEGCYHHKQCCGDAAWASRPEEGLGSGGRGILSAHSLLWLYGALWASGGGKGGGVGCERGSQLPYRVWVYSLQ